MEKLSIYVKLAGDMMRSSDNIMKAMYRKRRNKSKNKKEYIKLTIVINL